MWYSEISSNSKEETYNSHNPECPRPPSALGKQTREYSSDCKTAGCRGSEETEYHLLSPALFVCPSENCNCIRQQKRRTNSLHCPTNVEEYRALAATSLYVNTEPGHQAPESKPEETSDEEAFVAVQIPQSACDQNEGSDSEGVSGGDPGELARGGDGEAVADYVEGGD